MIIYEGIREFRSLNMTYCYVVKAKDESLPATE